MNSDRDNWKYMHALSSVIAYALDRPHTSAVSQSHIRAEQSRHKCESIANAKRIAQSFKLNSEQSAMYFGGPKRGTAQHGCAAASATLACHQSQTNTKATNSNTPVGATLSRNKPEANAIFLKTG